MSIPLGNTFSLADENHRIIEYLMLEGFHKDHGVQNFTELCQAWCSDFPGKFASRDWPPSQW